MQATDVINSTAQGIAPTTADRTGSSKLGKDEFVKLLLAQLGNQDPTAPSDSQAFVAQLAQFSSLEQLTNMNSQFDSLLLAQSSANQVAATSFVGKEATFRTDKLTLGTEGAAMASGSLSADAANVVVSIVDAKGATVRTLQLGARGHGPLDVSWDGRDEDGKRAATGDYTLRITATDTQGKTIDAQMRTSGVITGVSFENGYPELIVNGSSKVKMPDIVEIKQRSAT